MPLADIDPSKGYLFEQDIVGLYFERLRREDPVHLAHSKRYGAYWSVTRHADIMARGVQSILPGVEVTTE